MSMLLCYVKENRYAIDNQYIKKVVPWVELERMPSMHRYVLGVLNWGNRAIPVIDLCYLIEKKAANSLFHSRIILVENINHLSKSGQDLIGILAEQVTDVLDLNSSQFSSKNFSTPFPFIDGFYIDFQGTIRKIEVEELFKFLADDLFRVPENENKD